MSPSALFYAETWVCKAATCTREVHVDRRRFRLPAPARPVPRGQSPKALGLGTAARWDRNQMHAQAFEPALSAEMPAKYLSPYHASHVARGGPETDMKERCRVEAIGTGSSD